MYTGEQNRKKKRCLEFFTWFHSIRSHRFLNENPFFPIRSSFPTILDFWGSWEFYFLFLKTPFVPFIVLEMTVSIPRFQCKNRFEKRTTLGRDICKNVFKHGTLNQTTNPFCFFSNISAQGGPIFKLIFALKPWD